MINKDIKIFCCEDISQIENYDKAINDNTQVWSCHHRLETDENLSRKELKSMKMYYHRPANELIFLTHSKHMSLHHKDKIVSEETRKKQSESHKGKHWKLSEETRKKMSESAKKRSEETKKKIVESKKGNKYRLGKTFSDESRKKMSESHKGKSHSEETKIKMREAWKRRKEKLSSQDHMVSLAVNYASD